MIFSPCTLTGIFFLVEEHKLDAAKIEEVKRTCLLGHFTFWAAADETKGGVAISVWAGRGIEILDQGKDSEGRFIWIKVKMQDKTFGVCNLYAPRRIRERKALWRRLQVQLDFRVKWLTGGDHNFIEESSDKFGGVPPYIRHVSMEWHDFRDLHMLMCDPWVVHPAQRRRGSLQFSWTNEREKAAALIGCRLDRIYVPLAWVEHVVEYGRFTGTDLSDHAPAYLNLDLAETQSSTPSGQGYKIWRINESLLSEEGVQEKIESIWKEQLAAPNKGGISELLGSLDETRRLLREEGKRVAAKRRQKEDVLRREVARLQTMMEDLLVSDAILHDLHAAKTELKQFEQWKARGW